MNEIEKLNKIAEKSYIKGKFYNIGYNYITHKYEIIEYGNLEIPVNPIRKNLTKKQAIEYLKLILDILEVKH